MLQFKSNKEREIYIEFNLKRIMHAHGYDLGPTMGDPQFDRSWWFIRKGRQFQIESVLFQLSWNPKSILDIEFLGSWHSVERLRIIGFSTNASGCSPFHYQVGYMKKKAQNLLGDIVEMGPEESWQSLFNQLEKEILEVEPGIWDYLWQLHLKHQTNKEQQTSD